MTPEEVKKRYEAHKGYSNKQENSKELYVKRKALRKQKDFYPSREDFEEIRVLDSIDEGKTWFDDIAYFHMIKNSDGKFETLYCPKHNDGDDCPLCNKSESLMTSEEKSDREKGYALSVNKYYILKILDMNKKTDFVKFWRVLHSNQGKGALDYIMQLYKMNPNMLDWNNGSNIQILMEKNKNGNYKPMSYLPTQPSPVATRQENLDKIINEMRELNWRDIYSVYEIKNNIFIKDLNRTLTHYEYLELAAKGTTPRWDNINKKFIIPEVNVPTVQQITQQVYKEETTDIDFNNLKDDDF